MKLYKIIPKSWLRKDVRGFASPAAAHIWARENGWKADSYKVSAYRI